MDQRADSRQFYGICSAQRSDGSRVHNSLDPDDTLKPVHVRYEPICSCGSNALELARIPTFGDIMQLFQTHRSLAISTCFACDTPHAGANLVFKCQGQDCISHERCRALSSKGDVVPLPQVVCDPEKACDFYGEPAEDGLLVEFWPCNHCISLDGFSILTRNALEAGLGPEGLKEDPVSGYYLPTCPMGGAECKTSFIHEVQTFKLAGRRYYDQLKEWATRFECFYKIPSTFPFIAYLSLRYLIPFPSHYLSLTQTL